MNLNSPVDTSVVIALFIVITYSMLIGYKWGIKNCRKK